jgi:hypothetical protein
MGKKGTPAQLTNWFGNMRAEQVLRRKCKLVRFHFEWVNTQNMEIIEYSVFLSEKEPISQCLSVSCLISRGIIDVCKESRYILL